MCFFFLFLLVVFVCLLIISSPDCLKNQLYPRTQGCSSGQDCQFCHLCAPGGGDFHGFFVYRTLFLLGSFTFQVVKCHTVDGSEIRQTQPVELGTLSHDFRGFIHPRCLGMGRISSINSRVVNQPLVLLPKVKGISRQHPSMPLPENKALCYFLRINWGTMMGFRFRLFLGPSDSFFAKGFLGPLGQLPMGWRWRDMLQLFCEVVRRVTYFFWSPGRFSQIQFEFKLLALLVNHNDIFPKNYSWVVVSMCLLPFHHFDDLLYSSKWEAQPIQSTNGSNRRYFKFKKAHFRNKKSRYRGIICWSFGSWLFCVSWGIPGFPQISWFSNPDNLPTPLFPGAFAASFRTIFCFFFREVVP